MFFLVQDTGKSSLVLCLYSFTRVRGEWELFARASNIDIVATNSLETNDLLPCVLVELRVDRKVVASENYGWWKDCRCMHACMGGGAKGNVLKICFASNARLILLC